MTVHLTRQRDLLRLRATRPADGNATACIGRTASFGVNTVPHSGAPRPMKMGTIASPWRYDPAVDWALQLADLRVATILYYVSLWQADTLALRRRNAQMIKAFRMGIIAVVTTLSIPIAAGSAEADVIPLCRVLPNGVSAISRMGDAPPSLAQAVTERVGGSYRLEKCLILGM